MENFHPSNKFIPMCGLFINKWLYSSIKSPNHENNRTQINDCKICGEKLQKAKLTSAYVNN